ncbi:MAG: DNA topoisomerase, partial [Lishizhenia sp.]
NKKFGYSADETLKHVQSLYEKKFVTYPRVDTTYLSEDIYPKIPGILRGMKYYSQFTAPLLEKPIRKSKQVFDNKKVTDHHAIIPTGIVPSGITPQEQKVYDLIAKRFISVFYPDCKVSNTTVLGEVLKLEFKATGKQILMPGWRVVYQKEKEKESKKDDENLMPVFEKGEKGEHTPRVDQKSTSPPKHYTEATLLRAMETAGKQVDDEEARELMKDNGIGRPSTRANIIETLFRRRYLERKRKNIIATQTGIDLINTIQNDTLKSASMTGDWEKKLRLIEKGEYSADAFKQELIEMVVGVTNEVMFSKTETSITILSEEDAKKNKSKPKPRKKVEVKLEDEVCPKCKQNKIIKGKSAYGCAGYKQGCKFVLPFQFLNKKLTKKQIHDLLNKGKTTVIKGIEIPGSKEKKEGKLAFTADFNIEIE